MSGIDKRDDYDVLRDYMENLYSEKSIVKSAIGSINSSAFKEVVVNLNPLSIARPTYKYGIAQGFSSRDTKDFILGFIRKKFGDKAATRARSRLEDR